MGQDRGMGKALFPHLDLKCAPHHIVTSHSVLSPPLVRLKFLQLGRVALRTLKEKDVEFEATLGYIRKRPSLQLTPSVPAKSGKLIGATENVCQPCSLALTLGKGRKMSPGQGQGHQAPHHTHLTYCIPPRSSPRSVHQH